MPWGLGSYAPPSSAGSIGGDPAWAAGPVGRSEPPWQPSYDLTGPMGSPGYAAPLAPLGQSRRSAVDSFNTGGFSSSFLGLFDRLPALSDSALSWYRESNRSTEQRGIIRAQENVQLAALGFTTGRARPAFSGALAARASNGAGLTDVLGSLKPWLPIAGVGLLLVKLFT